MRVPDLATLHRRAELRAEARAADAAPAGHVDCRGLIRLYRGNGVEVLALQGLDLRVERGELLAVVGASGSGKSTLLNILSGLDAPTAGSVTVAGFDLLDASPRRRLYYRRRIAGFVWQQTARNLLPDLTAVENVELPMRLAGTFRGRAARRRAIELLDLVEAGNCVRRWPIQMSGGEQQRCAIAVAIANDPQVVFADEPTGELDQAAGAAIFRAFQQINAELGTTVVVVTHDSQVSDQVRRTVAIRDGRTSTEVLREHGPANGGSGEPTFAEYALLDRTGRVQLPAGFVGSLGLRDRVRLTLEGDHIEVHDGHQTRGVADDGRGCHG